MRAPGHWGTAKLVYLCPEHGIEHKAERIFALERHPGHGDLVITVPLDLDDVGQSGAELS